MFERVRCTEYARRKPRFVTLRRVRRGSELSMSKGEGGLDFNFNLPRDAFPSSESVLTVVYYDTPCFII